MYESFFLSEGYSYEWYQPISWELIHLGTFGSIFIQIEHRRPELWALMCVGGQAPKAARMKTIKTTKNRALVWLFLCLILQLFSSVQSFRVQLCMLDISFS